MEVVPEAKFQPLISVIIPVYNRSHLICETLKSIQAQTYENWECIVVDDGSLDETVEIVQRFSSEDSRIKLYVRPESLLKGGNVCRNFGFLKSAGDFINWFDSDDIMEPDHLQTKIAAFDDDLDFVIANSVNFDEEGKLSRTFVPDYHKAITPENFIRGRIGWVTNDAMIRRDAVSIKFNEKLEADQEYNFFARLLFKTTRGKYIRRDLTRRRIHSGSIQKNLSENPPGKMKQNFISEILLLEDIGAHASQNLIRRSLKRLIRFSFFLTPRRNWKDIQWEVTKLLFKQKEYLALFNYSLWSFLNLVTGKGYKFLRYATKSLEE